MAADYILPWSEDDPLAAVAGEPPKAVQALHDYAALGPGRSLPLLIERYRSGMQGASPTVRLTTVREWSAAWHWQDRVAAFDELERKREREAAAALRAERAKVLADRNWELSQKLTERALAMLDFPLATVEQVTKTRQGKDGKTTEIHMNVVKPARWALRDAAIIADVAAKLAALAAGEPTERTAHILGGLNPRDLEDMTLDQLLALRAQVEKAGR